MRYTAILILLLLIGIGCATVYPGTREAYVLQWLSVAPPTPGSEQWRCANFSHHVWEVRSNAGVVTAYQKNFFDTWTLPFPRPELPTGEDGAPYPLKVPDGWIVGFNGGEFGRSLRWFSPDGKESYKISDHQIIRFVDIAGRHYAIEGIAHMGTNIGSLIQLLKDTNIGKWTTAEVALLPEEPAAVVLEGDESILIVTYSGLVRVTTYGAVSQILKGTFWGGLYPSSAILADPDTLYVGMNQGVAEVSNVTGNPKVRWLVPSREYLESEWESYKKMK